MACACKVKRQLDYMRSRYGDGKAVSGDRSGLFWAYVKDVLLKVIVFPIIPLMLLVSVGSIVKGKPINMGAIAQSRH